MKFSTARLWIVVGIVVGLGVIAICRALPTRTPMRVAVQPALPMPVENPPLDPRPPVGLDMVLTATPANGVNVARISEGDRIEEFLILGSAAAPTEYHYRLDLPPSIRSVRHIAGFWEFRDGDETPRSRLHPVWAADAQGAPVAVRADLHGLRELARCEDGSIIYKPSGTLDLEIALAERPRHYPVVIDPLWSSTGSLAVKRRDHSVTLLLDGKILVAGTYYTGNQKTCELYDPAKGVWTLTGQMSFNRWDHTATLLANGKVLVAGSASNDDTTCELYDPATGSWSPTGSMAAGRHEHAATFLPDGRLLVTGGYPSIASCEIYNPASGTWSSAGTMAHARYDHAATALPNGKVLIVGGTPTAARKTCEIFNPQINTWSSTGSMSVSRYDLSLTVLPDGKVIAVGGTNLTSGKVCELYDPATGTWTTTGALVDGRMNHTATLLPSGRLLVAGGFSSSFAGPTKTAELYNPATGSWTATSSMSLERRYQVATLLPKGKVLIIGGEGEILSSTTSEIYDPQASGWASTGSLSVSTPRYNHSATLLPNGRVLVAGGNTGSGAVASCQVYDPASGAWSAVASMSVPREGHTATLLSGGKVLVTGGSGGLPTCELFDPNEEAWSATGSMMIGRSRHVAMALPSGKVLVSGGLSGGALSACEIYDPATGAWSTAGTMATARYDHTATLLSNGKILIAGGLPGPTANCELYAVTGGGWSTTGGLPSGRASHTATPLQNGKVLVAGGASTTACALYDPAAGTWSSAASMTTARTFHTATLLASGDVLVAGGSAGLSSCELYDTSLSKWVATNSMTTGRASHTATLLSSGKVLAACGQFAPAATCELYDYSGALYSTGVPVIASVDSAVNAGSTVTVAGSGFRGVSPAAGANGGQDSPTNYPIVVLQRVGSRGDEAIYALPASSWLSGTSLNFTLPPGTQINEAYYILSVVANGVRSAGRILWVTTVPNPPLDPTQHLTLGGPAQPAGFVTGSTSLTFKAQISDPDTNNTVRLQIEIRPTNMSFTGIPTAETPLLASGSTAALTVTGLLPNNAYHWQVRTRDNLGAASPWVSFGGNAESEPDLTVLFNNVPNAPASLSQHDDASGPAQPAGFVDDDLSVTFKGSVSDPDAGQILFLEVEVQPIGTTFTGVPTAANSSGVVTVSDLTANTVYHWQARVTDNLGASSGWVSFGNNFESAADFALDSTGPIAGVVNDGTGSDIDAQTATDSISANWSGFSDPQSGILAYEWSIEPSVLSWTSVGAATAATKTGLSLAPGTTYTVVVRATNGVGLQVTKSSDGVLVDPSGPIAGTVNDGTGADIDTQSSSSAISANWSGFSDPQSGILAYEWSIEPSVMSWTSVGTATSATKSGLSLVPGTTYTVKVRATNGVGLQVTSSSDGVMVVTSPPSAGIVNDGTGADIDWQSSTSAISANWSGFSDPIGIAGYEWKIDPNVMPFTSVGLATSATKSGLSLNSGTAYTVVVRATNVAGLQVTKNSDGVSVDASGPVVGTVSDGTGADIVFQTTANSISANWSGFSDPQSGIVGYEWAIGTTSGGENVQPFASQGLSTSATNNALLLSDGVTYYVTVRATNGAGLKSAAVSNGVTVDTSQPIGGIVNDGEGADIDWQASLAGIWANWSGFSDGQSGIVLYEWAIGTTPGGTQVQDFLSAGLSTSASNTSLTLTAGTTYYVIVKATNGAGTSTTAVSDGVTVSGSAPTAGTVNDGTGADIDWQSSTTTIAANWSGFGDPTGIAGYQWAIGTSPGGTQIQGFVSIGTATSASNASLALPIGLTYYVTVKATNAIGLTATAWSDGVAVDTPPTSGSVNDGTGADIDWQSSTTQIDANWSGFSDAQTGITGYEWSIDPNVMPWASVGTATSASKSGLTLTPGTTYIVKVRATNGVGLQVTASSDGVTVTSATPTAGSVNDGVGADIDWQSSTSVIDVNWAGFSDSTGIAGYEWKIEPGVMAWTSVGTATSATKTALTLTPGTTYTVSVRATNAAGAQATATSDGVTVAVSGPVAGTVIDGTNADIDWQYSTTTLTAHWFGFSDAAGIAGYEWAIGTAPTASNVQPFVSTGLSTQASASSLTLPSGTTYYVTVRATNLAGLQVVASSDGVTISASAAGPMVVTPSMGLIATGPTGSIVYTVKNAGSFPMSWTARSQSDWVTISPESGTLAAGASQTVTATVNSEAGFLPPGSHSDWIVFSNASGGGGHTARPLRVDIAGPTPDLDVTPRRALAAAGQVGGPFDPSGIAFTVTNHGAAAFTWEAFPSKDWLVVSPPSGTIMPGESQTVQVGFTAQAALLGEGSHFAIVDFTNIATGNGDTHRCVRLNVTANPPPEMTSVNPAAGGDVETTSSTIDLSGTTSDDFGVSDVTWCNPATGESGTAAGTAFWSVPVALALGSNPIVVTVFDVLGQGTSVVLTVNRVEPSEPQEAPPPVVAGVIDDGGSSGRSCGLVGLDVALALGAFWLIRRRRNRR